MAFNQNRIGQDGIEQKNLMQLAVLFCTTLHSTTCLCIHYLPGQQGGKRFPGESVLLRTSTARQGGCLVSGDLTEYAVSSGVWGASQ